MTSKHCQHEGVSSNFWNQSTVVCMRQYCTHFMFWVTSYKYIYINILQLFTNQFLYNINIKVTVYWRFTFLKRTHVIWSYEFNCKSSLVVIFVRNIELFTIFYRFFLVTFTTYHPATNVFWFIACRNIILEGKLNIQQNFNIKMKIVSEYWQW